jgi:hypothetical protein
MEGDIKTFIGEYADRILMPEDEPMARVGCVGYTLYIYGEAEAPGSLTHTGRYITCVEGYGSERYLKDTVEGTRTLRIFDTWAEAIRAIAEESIDSNPEG